MCTLVKDVDKNDKSDDLQELTRHALHCLVHFLGFHSPVYVSIKCTMHKQHK